MCRRRLRDDDLKRQLAFQKWKTGDTTTPLRDFYKQPLLKSSPPMLQMLAQLANSRAGKFLTELPGSYRESNIAAPNAAAAAALAGVTPAAAGAGAAAAAGQRPEPFHESRARRPVPRLQVIQAHLARRFQNAGAGHTKPGVLRKQYQQANSRRALQQQRLEQADKHPVNALPRRQPSTYGARHAVMEDDSYSASEEEKRRDQPSLRDWHLTGKARRKQQQQQRCEDRDSTEAMHPATPALPALQRGRSQLLHGDDDATVSATGAVTAPVPLSASRGPSINMRDLM